MKILNWLLSLIMLVALGVGLGGTYTLKTSRYPILSLDPQITEATGSFDSQSEGAGPAGTRATFFHLTDYPHARFFILGTGYDLGLVAGDRLGLAISQKDAANLPGLTADQDILVVGMKVNGQKIVDADQTMAKAGLLIHKVKLLFSVLIDLPLLYFILRACRALWQRRR